MLKCLPCLTRACLPTPVQSPGTSKAAGNQSGDGTGSCSSLSCRPAEPQNPAWEVSVPMAKEPRCLRHIPAAQECCTGLGAAPERGWMSWTSFAGAQAGLAQGQEGVPAQGFMVPSNPNHSGFSETLGVLSLPGHPACLYSTPDECFHFLCQLCTAVFGQCRGRAPSVSVLLQGSIPRCSSVGHCVGDWEQVRAQSLRKAPVVSSALPFSLAVLALLLLRGSQYPVGWQQGRISA